MSENITLKSGLEMPRLGLGTWRMGEAAGKAGAEADAIRHALDHGFRHIDTAEMYGDGGSEEVIGDALAGRSRDDVFLTSKFYPMNASPSRMVRSCEASLARLGTDHLDLYLLHWPGSVPFEDTLEGARQLLDAGKIRAFGVSNVDVDFMREIVGQGLDALIDVNQVMYSPARRGIEFDLLPYLESLDIACIAYTPIEPAPLARNTRFAALAAERGLSPSELALSWHLTRGRSAPIPKSARPDHIDGLLKAAATTLDAADLAEIDAAFPPPVRPQPLDII